MSNNTKMQSELFSLANLKENTSIWLTLTNLCNIHCKYCFNYVHNNHEHMPPKLAVDIIKSHMLALDKSKATRIDLVYFGGEPTINQSALLETIDFITDHDIHCTQRLMTNGLINNSLYKKLLQKNINFQVSFDGKRGNLRFNKNLKRAISDETINTIKKLTSDNETVDLRATIHAGNVEHIKELIYFCDKYRITKLMCSPICDFGNSKKNLINPPEINAYIDNMLLAHKVSLDYGVTLEVRGEDYFLNMLHSKLNIPFVWLPDGYVAMTITHATSKEKGSHKIIIGKYNQQTQSIDLNYKIIDAMKRSFYKNVDLYCSSCPIKKLCKGNLHFTPFATDTFEPSRDSYFCNIARKMIHAFPSSKKLCS